MDKVLDKMDELAEELTSKEGLVLEVCGMETNAVKSQNYILRH
jgi:hypothetical protein